jgi:hypothetical protein
MIIVPAEEDPNAVDRGLYAEEDQVPGFQGVFRRAGGEGAVLYWGLGRAGGW